jgi:acyl-CoA reductase-like NAD-dependent aldehyde dehydrogenase
MALLRNVAALTTSGVLSGTCPIVADPYAHAVVVKEPLGVILGIAPWNEPLILGFRAVAAAVAAGNTAILKVNISPC